VSASAWIRRHLSDPQPTAIPWSDDPAQEYNTRAATVLDARVMPSRANATEIVLEGICPRCCHRIVATHPTRGVELIEVESLDKAEAAHFPNTPRKEHTIKRRKLTGQCACSHEHPGRPSGTAGCGAPFALWVIWDTSGDSSEDRRALLSPAEGTSLLRLQEDKDLQHAAEGQLANVRKAAESWRNGLAALLGILTVVFFVKGKDSFNDIEPGGWRWALAITLLAAAVLAVNGAYRALRAAYGAPRDEYVGRASFALSPPRRLRTTPGEIEEYGSLSAWRHAFAVQAIKDLWWAKASTVAALLLVMVAAVITWIAPGPPPPAFVEVRYKGAPQSVCGELIRGDGRLVVKEGDGKTTSIGLDSVSKIKIVAACH
jgi:hypothetical protein